MELYNGLPPGILLEDIPIPWQHVKMLSKENEELRWTVKWKQEPRFRQTKFFFPEPDKGKSMAIINEDKSTVGHLISMLTGHAFMARHNALVLQSQGQQADPTCTVCLQGEEMPIHLVSQCPVIAARARELFTEFKGEETSAPAFQWSVAEMLAFIKLTGDTPTPPRAGQCL